MGNNGTDYEYLRKRNLTNNPMKNPETRKKLSNTVKGRIPANIKLLGHYPNNPRNKGKKFSEKIKKKMRLSAINYINNHSKGIQPRLGKYEKEILDKIEKSKNIKIIRQHPISGYFVDGYLEKENIVFEVDEKPKISEREINRENIIKKELNCAFVRIPIHSYNNKLNIIMEVK